MVKLGKTAPQRRRRRPRTSTSSSRARRRTRSSSCSPSSATSARRAIRTRTRTEHPGADDVQRAAAQRDPRAGPHEGQLDGLAAGLQPRPLPAALLRHRRRGASRVKTYYERQSSGRYSVDGQVTDWVKVRYNEARYGRSNGYPCAGNVCSNTWDLIKDAIDTWVADQHAKGRTDEQIKADLASYDQWDRNDFDHDGNFNEPDGYIDHFQIVHAGGDQADGDPHQGEDAIWSHRWKAFQNTGQGPTGNKDGGTQIGTTGLWVADYTIQPENGGVSVFAHEYGHDLGLPDEYDTAAAADNAVNWWTLMAQSRVVRRRATRASARARPTSARGTSCSSAGSTTRSSSPARTRRSTSARTSTTAPRRRALVVVLPKKTRHDHARRARRGHQAVVVRHRRRLRGDADALRSPCRPGTDDAVASRRAGTSRTAGRTRATTRTSRSTTAPATRRSPARSPSPPRATASTASAGGYEPATFDLSAYAGKTVSLRFHYKTDGAARATRARPIRPASSLDEIKLTNGTPDACSPTAPRTAPTAGPPTGFSHRRRDVRRRCTTTTTSPPTGRTRRYDRYLQTGPYNFGFPDRPDWVEHFPYQNGLLVSYWDTSFSDNNESQHPGQGQILPIDANPRPIYRLDGKPWRGRVQTYDAPFGLEKSDSFTLHAQETGAASYIRGQAAHAALRRPQRVLGPGAADRRREGPARGRDRSASPSRAARRCGSASASAPRAPRVTTARPRASRRREGQVEVRGCR